MKNKDIFNLNDISDLSSTTRKYLNKHRLHSGCSNILNLFDIKETLSLDEIIVGLYRLYKMEKSRSWLASTLYSLSARGLIKKDGKKYTRIKK